MSKKVKKPEVNRMMMTVYQTDGRSLSVDMIGLPGSKRWALFKAMGELMFENLTPRNFKGKHMVREEVL